MSSTMGPNRAGSPRVEPTRVRPTRVEPTRVGPRSFSAMALITLVVLIVGASPLSQASAPGDMVPQGGPTTPGNDPLPPGVQAALFGPTKDGEELLIADEDCCNQTQPAVARGDKSGHYIVAWMDQDPEHPAEPERGQIYVRFVLSDGSLTNTAWFQDGVYNSAPDIAYDSLHDRFLVVWENSCLNRPCWDISAFLFDATTGAAVGDIVQIVRSDDYNFRKPAVVFNADASEYLVVYQYRHKDWGIADWDIGARRVIAHDDGTLEVVNFDTQVVGFIVSSESDPEILPDVAYDQEGMNYLIVWENHTNGGPERVVGRIMEPDGDLPGVPTDIAASVLGAKNPAIAYNSAAQVGQFLVVYEEDLNVAAQRVWSSYPDPVTAGAAFDIAATATDEDQADVVFSPACGCYLSTFHRKENSWYRFHVQQVHGTLQEDGQLDGDPLEIDKEQWGWKVGASLRAGRIACGANTNQCLAVWQFNDEERQVADVHAQGLRCAGSSGGRVTAFLPVVLRKQEIDTSLLFADGFADADSGWGVGETDSYKAGYLNGEYQLQAKQANSVVRAMAPVNCANCSIEVDARFEGTPNYGYGLVFAKEGGNYYAFLAFPYADACDLVVYTDSSGTLLERKACDLTGAGDNLKVEWQAPNIRTYVNGAKVHDLTDGTYAGVRDVGLTTYHQGDARYDKFVVRSLE